MRSHKSIQNVQSLYVHCVNRFAQLHVDQAGSVCSDVHIDSVDVIGHRIQALEGNNKERRLQVATWNFSG